MYAQTITYGLFSAAVSRTVPGAGTAVIQDNVTDMVPVTNPFLREMLQSFIKAGGRKDKLDFDEFGIQEVVDLLNSEDTNLEAVLRDFGNLNRQEDPVVHFYEDFLNEYDKQLKVQRGVFTPRSRWSPTSCAACTNCCKRNLISKTALPIPLPGARC